MTLITGTLTDVGGVPDTTAVMFYSLLRESSDGDSIVTPQPVRVRPDATGAISEDLDPGYAVVSYRGATYSVTVPASGPVDFWDLIAAAVVLPPGTSAESVAEAVQAYLAMNPLQSTALADITTIGHSLVTATDAADARGDLGMADSVHGVFPVAHYASVQAAIDACAAAGGGTVKLPAGPTYVPTGGFHLASRVTLEGPHVRHANGYQVYKDGSGFYRPGNISTVTGLAAYDGGYLVPAAGSTGPMVWASQYDNSYAIRNLTIFGVDVYGQNISAAAIPSWTNSFAWIETTGTRTSTSTTVSCGGIQVMPQMVGQAITGTGIPASTTVSAVNVGANTLTLSAAATSTATGTASFTVAGGEPVPDVPVSGRQAISFGSVAYPGNRPRCLIENVYTWGCGSGGPGTTANYRTWTETAGSTASGSNTVQLSSQTASPLMIGAPITGTGIPAGAIVVAINPTFNRVFLSANATATGSGLTLTLGDSTFTTVLQQVYVGTPAIYIGVREYIVRGVTCFMGGGDGLVCDGSDGQIDADNMMGFNSGWGLRMTIASGPCRALGAIDSFFNGIYGGAGNAFFEGSGHAFVKLQCNDGGKESIRFGRCVNSNFYHLGSDGAGLRFATDATRYSNVLYAPPAASATFPIWNTGQNTGVVIFGGAVSTQRGFEDHLFDDVGATASVPTLFGMSVSGTTWNGGTPGSDVFSLVNAFISNWRFKGGMFPDRLASGLSLPPYFRTTSGSIDNMQVYSLATNTAVAGYGPNGALYQAVNAQTLSSNGAVTLDASKGNIQAVTLAANATSSSITNAKLGQVLTIEWLQDATGSRTYVWPTNCVFTANGAAPTGSTTAAHRDSVTFRYDGTNWQETGRSAALSGAGLGTPASGDLSNCTAVTAATASKIAQRDANGNLLADVFIPTKTPTVTAAGTLTMTIDSAQIQEFTGSTTHTVKLPTTGVTAGMAYTVINNSSPNSITVQSSGANTILAVQTTRQAVFTARIDAPTAAADWIITSTNATASAAFSTLAMRDSNTNLFADQFIATVTSTPTAAGTTTMTIADTAVQVFTGSTTQTVKLPTTSITEGMELKIVNRSSGAVTVQSSGANTVATVAAGAAGIFMAFLATPTAAADWKTVFNG